MLQLAGVATLSLCLLIAVFGLRSGRDETILKSSIQTSGHFVFFAALAFCSAIASPVLIPWLKSRRWPQYLVGFTTSTTVGGLLELAQKFIPGRDSSIQDFVFDVTGAIFAISLLALRTDALSDKAVRGAYDQGQDVDDPKFRPPQQGGSGRWG